MAEFRSPYPGYNVLDKWDSPSWNPITRRVVADRLYRVPPRQFLDPHLYAVLEAACARLLPQPERPEPVPIAPWIDQKLVRGISDGYRFAGMPPMQQTWQRGLEGLDQESRQRFGQGVPALNGEQQDTILQSLQDDRARAPVWQELSAGKFFSAHLLKEVVDIYYAHPAAWNEIGFGGPASPRGYVRMSPDRRDPWEAEEVPSHD
ncbi:MAG: gluconate 2-dehydrogenase subunit 3 family protein [Candidatus Competibacteraceae bacterium]|nr:gluconate 2-dehydrogenase subunit 3 family protein [Candidatus Competibacteraceae bacterium]